MPLSLPFHCIALQARCVRSAAWVFSARTETARSGGLRQRGRFPLVHNDALARNDRSLDHRLLQLEVRPARVRTREVHWTYVGSIPKLGLVSQ